jgi:hypothetical protein
VIAIDIREKETRRIRREGLKAPSPVSRRDFEKSKAILRKKGLATRQEGGAARRVEGLVGTYIHRGRRFGVLVEVDCETELRGPKGLSRLPDPG